MNGEGSYFLVKFCRLDDSGVKVLEDMLSEKTEYRQKIDWGGFSSRALLHEANRERSSVSLILFDLSGRMRRASESKLRDEIAESLRGLFDVKVSKISAEDLSKTHPEIEKRILSALASRGVRCDGSSAALTLKSEKQIIEEASGVCGWGAFSEALARIARRMDNDASGRLNLNAAFVADAENCAGDYIRVLYDFYFARGAVTAPVYIPRRFERRSLVSRRRIYVRSVRRLRRAGGLHRRRTKRHIGKPARSALKEELCRRMRAD